MYEFKQKIPPKKKKSNKQNGIFLKQLKWENVDILKPLLFWILSCTYVLPPFQEERCITMLIVH